jgi:hypothetical protein
LAESAKTAQLALFAAKMLPNLPKRATGLIVWDQPDCYRFYEGSNPPFYVPRSSSSQAIKQVCTLLARRKSDQELNEK